MRWEVGEGTTMRHERRRPRSNKKLKQRSIDKRHIPSLSLEKEEYCQFSRKFENQRMLSLPVVVAEQENEYLQFTSDDGWSGWLGRRAEAEARSASCAGAVPEVCEVADGAIRSDEKRKRDVRANKELAPLFSLFNLVQKSLKSHAGIEPLNHTLNWGEDEFN
ncbi:hypothetical protein L2E82_44615 [Cichorium intybus]|uniref:Uncharacterized protein n=1 Tax=Cichorium intybus TaxID=13427 RepID=A0ACB8ZQT6_CICIN|nr:hypothetical protein L2E82_44615 [Cichorium intybus]